MARDFFRIEKGLHITGENNETGVKVLFGSALPGGDAGEQDGAEIGSLYHRTSGELYQKIANAGATADWLKFATVNDVTNLSWRSEVVRAVTNDTLTAGSSDPSTWSDNESGITDADFAVGEYVIGDADGTPALFEITAISSPNLTLAAASNPLADNDTFLVRKYLPDSPADQEAQAIVLYNGSALIKISDFNWELATGINLSGSYTAANGSVSSADTVESAIEKLDGNQQDLITLSGVTQGSVDLGTFTGETISDNNDVKGALQELETELETKDSLERAEQTGVTTEVTLDEVLVDNVYAAKWLLQYEDDASPENKEAVEVFAIHDGTAAADASNVDDTVYAKVKIGSGVNATISVDLNGTGAAQTMRLRVSASSAATFRARLIEVFDI